MIGYIYIQSNPIFNEKLLKIGLSRNPEKRRKSLSSAGLPSNYSVEAIFSVKDMAKAESLIFDQLAAFRYNKEFFCCSKEVAIKACINAQQIINQKICTNTIIKDLSEYELDQITSKWTDDHSHLTPDDIDI
jgi:hypothetical protein